MKINLGKLLNIVNHVVAAVPAIVEAVKPIVHEIKGSSKSTTPGRGAARPPLSNQSSSQ